MCLNSDILNHCSLTRSPFWWLIWWQLFVNKVLNTGFTRTWIVDLCDFYNPKNDGYKQTMVAVSIFPSLAADTAPLSKTEKHHSWPSGLLAAATVDSTSLLCKCSPCLSGKMINSPSLNVLWHSRDGMSSLAKQVTCCSIGHCQCTCAATSHWRGCLINKFFYHLRRHSDLRSEMSVVLRFYIRLCSYKNCTSACHQWSFRRWFPALIDVGKFTDINAKKMSKVVESDFFFFLEQTFERWN